MLDWEGEEVGRRLHAGPDPHPVLSTFKNCTERPQQGLAYLPGPLLK